ncbi:MAG TPA: Uma2 family endonuclease [Longimicrobium sp.]
MAKAISGYAAYRFLVRVKRGRWVPEPGELYILDLGRKATVRDLRWVKGQAEIVDDKLVVMAPSGWRNARARGALLSSLMDYEDCHKGDGVAVTSTVAFLIDAPHRRSICADVSWYTGPRSGPDFPPVAPVFAAEVRDYANYGNEAEEHFAIKLGDYFAAGTKVVWDVDVLREELIRVYRADDPENPTIYRRDGVAEAEPAVPGWRFPVNELWDD